MRHAYVHRGQFIKAISVHRSEAGLRNYIGRPTSEKLGACSDILLDSLSGGPHQSQQPSFTALSSRAIFSRIQLLFIHKTQASISLFSNCHVQKLVFVSHNLTGFHRAFCFQSLFQKLKKILTNVLNSTSKTIPVCTLLQIVNIDGLTLNYVSYFPYTSFVLQLLPPCFTTEQSTIEGSLFVK